MHRKQFLSGLLPLAMIAKTDLSFATPASVPSYLQPGDTVGITSPAGNVTLEDLQPAVQQLKEWGFTVRIGKAPGQKENTYGGSDEVRLQDLQDMLDDSSVKAILCARGGYGVVRIIDLLNFSGFKKNPKWIIGFSDITVLLSHVFTNFGIASIHAKMATSFPKLRYAAEPSQIDSIESIRKCLSGEKIKYEILSHSENKKGKTNGILVGGNVKVLENLAGTRSDLLTRNHILFLEDTGEYLYNIDRMFWNLKRTGKLDHLKGLIIGGFKVKPDDAGEEFNKTIQDIVLEKIKDCTYPVCFDFPVGHQKANYALKIGVSYQLSVADITVLQEL